MRYFLSIAFLLSTLSPLFSQVDLQSGLVACYSFSGNPNDSSGHDHHGTVHGATLTADRNGIANNAYRFDGSSDYISIPAQPFINSNYSYSVWAKGFSVPADGDVGNIFSIGDGTSRHQTVNFANSYSTAGFVGINVGGYNVGTPPTTSVQSGILPNINQWYHIVAVRTNTALKMFVDGVFIGSTSTQMNAPYYGNQVKANFGTRCNFIQYFHGAIDDVSIYNRAINEDEVKELYKNGLACSPSLIVAVNEEEEDIFIPNLITPDNSDILNQVFSLFIKYNDEYQLYPSEKQFFMRIFNPWGREIFSTGDILTGWQGREAVSGVYFYSIAFGSKNYKGWVQVIR